MKKEVDIKDFSDVTKRTLAHIDLLHKKEGKQNGKNTQRHKI